MRAPDSTAARRPKLKDYVLPWIFLKRLSDFSDDDSRRPPVCQAEVRHLL